MDANNIIKEIANRLKNQGYCQVGGYNRFIYIHETDKAVILLREKGTETRIPYSKLAQAVEAVRIDPAIYQNGPSGLRRHGITHITSPVWSLLHLLTLTELTEGEPYVGNS